MKDRFTSLVYARPFGCDRAFVWIAAHKIQAEGPIFCLLEGAVFMDQKFHAHQKRRSCMTRYVRSVCHFLLAVPIVLSFGTVLTSCSQADVEDPAAENSPYPVAAGPSSTIHVSEVSGLTLSVDQEEYSCTNTEITYSLENSTDIIYAFGPATTSLEVWQDGEWHSLAVRTDIENLIVSTIGYLAPAHETHTNTKNFFAYGDLVSAGTYRLVIGVNPHEDEQGPVYYLAAEFTVTE